MAITSEAEVVVKDMAYTFILFVGVRLILAFVAEILPVEPVSVLPTMAIVETEFVTVPAVFETVTAVDVRETFTGFATAFVIVEAVVDGVTVPVIVTVPNVAVATFTLRMPAPFATVTTVLERATVTVPKVAVATFTLPVIVTVPSVAVATLTFPVTFTGFAAALVMVEAVVLGVTVPVMVTVPRVADEIFIFPPTTLVVTVPVTVVEAVMLVEDTVEETDPPPMVTTVFEIVTAVFTRETLTGFPTAFVMVLAVEDRDTVPTVMLTRRFPASSTRTG